MVRGALSCQAVSGLATGCPTLSRIGVGRIRSRGKKKGKRLRANPRKLSGSSHKVPVRKPGVGIPTFKGIGTGEKVV